MEDLSQIISHLPERHQVALQWFAERAGEEHPWPQPLEFDGGTVRLASKAKGIYKPRWSNYALSVRQVLGGPYADLDPVFRDDGTWSYAYFQENSDPSKRDVEFTNRGLVACWQDRVPVGVMRQTGARPDVRYHVLGVALVAGWDEGYFFLEGFSRDGRSEGPGPRAQVTVLTGIAETSESQAGAFDPIGVTDARERTIGSITRRRGQPAFRRQLLELYSHRCAITGCDVEGALEAAHITPYRGDETNHPTNGLLLRADVHVLFDVGLLGVDPDSMQVVIASVLKGTQYEEFAGSRLAVPSRHSVRPSSTALREHLRWSQLTLGESVISAASRNRVEG